MVQVCLEHQVYVSNLVVDWDNNDHDTRVSSDRDRSPVGTVSAGKITTKRPDARAASPVASMIATSQVYRPDLVKVLDTDAVVAVTPSLNVHRYFGVVPPDTEAANVVAVFNWIKDGTDVDSVMLLETVNDAGVVSPSPRVIPSDPHRTNLTVYVPGLSTRSISSEIKAFTGYSYPSLKTIFQYVFSVVVCAGTTGNCIDLSN